MSNPETYLEGIAIVGMAGRFPGAPTLAEFWQNLRNGVESVSFFSVEELAAAGVPKSLLNDPDFVRAKGVLADADTFDADFFGYIPSEAEMMDPQQRVFLECAWSALEDAGYDPARYPGLISVFGGMSQTTYLPLLRQLDPHGAKYFGYPLRLGTDKDYLTTRVSYKLNLRGTSINVQTACSTSLVAVCQACQSLLSYQSDTALAGGVAISIPLKGGHVYQEGGIHSSDGHCRAFDAKSQGIVEGDGVGIVVLKRLADAVNDGDTVHAVIKGFAVNNDGSAKVGFTAPSSDGQADAISTALAVAGFSAETISYVEAHGTGTPLGDPIEIEGLTKAFRVSTERKGFCAIGSLKTNVGHMDTAAGVGGLIKTVLSLRHRELPPSLHFTEANPQIDFANTPFFVNDRLRDWVTPDAALRRAGVSSFGLGGTNAHVVIEEAPMVTIERSSAPAQLFVLSARTASALDAATAQLGKFLQLNPGLPLEDAAYTLQVGRHAFAHRRAFTCCDQAEAVQVIETRDVKRIITQTAAAHQPRVVFMFPGQGAQHVGMAREMFLKESAFRVEVERCCKILQPALGLDLRDVLYPGSDREAWAAGQLAQTLITQPALFTIEYALARWWISLGVLPTAMIGHSVGEYVAGCLADVFTLEEGLRLVANRARLVQAQAPGCMLAVRLGEADLIPLLGDTLSLAAINSPKLCVASGSHEAIVELEEKLTVLKIAARRLATSHAFHSAMMDPVIAPFTELLRQVPLRAPQIPYVSNVTAQWITEAEATNPSYWAGHVRQAVRFADGIAEIAKDPKCILLEVGPGQTLSQLSRQHPARAAQQLVLSTLPPEQSGTSDHVAALSSVGQIWTAGVNIEWSALHTNVPRRRVGLPTYPFERKRYWPSPPEAAVIETSVEPDLSANSLAGVAQGEDPSANPISIQIQTITPTAEPISELMSASLDRKDRILQEMTRLLHELSGMDVVQIEPGKSFLELGFDSLFLGQASQAFQKAFGVRIRFRDFFEAAPTPTDMATLLDQRIPADKFTAPAPTRVALIEAPVLPTPVCQSSAKMTSTMVVAPAIQFAPVVEASAVERIVAQQLQTLLEITRQQLAALGQTAVTPVMTEAGSSIESPTTSTTLSAAPKPAAAVAAKSVPAADKSTTAIKVFAQAVFKDTSDIQWQPTEKTHDGGLTARQKQGLSELIKSYCARTAKSKTLTQEMRPYLADPRAIVSFAPLWKETVYQIVSDHTAGGRMWDVDGNEWLDVTLGFGASAYGHNPPFVMQAIKEQMEKGMELGVQSQLAAKVAKLFCELTGHERVCFCTAGTEAVMGALRLARTATGRDRFAMFIGDTHGRLDEVLGRPVVINNQHQALPAAAGIAPHTVKPTLFLEFGDPKSLEIIEQYADELAAVLVEPVRTRSPDLQPVEWLHQLHALAKRRGITFIMDEVVTGFRVHQGGAQKLLGIDPDLSTWGKAVAGGMAIGVISGKAEYMDALDGGMWNFGDDSAPEARMTNFGGAGTFAKHPLSMAAALATLTHVKEVGPSLQENTSKKAERFVTTLNQYFRDQRLPIHLERFRTFWVPRVLGDRRFEPLLFVYLRNEGIHIYVDYPCYICTVHTEEDIDQLIASFKRAVHAMNVAGFLSTAPDQPPQPARADARDRTPGEPDRNGAPAPTANPALVALSARHVAMQAIGPSQSGHQGFKSRFSMYFFSNAPAEYAPDKYDLLLAGARFADQNGFLAVLFPERHFHPVGGFSPNPSILAAALARETRHVQLRGASVVLPLHNPIRIAEEWSVVDNLSNGRVGISIASGWHPNDFVFFPGNYERRREICVEGMNLIRRLWRGEAIPATGGTGKALDIRLFPAPKQAELPIWFTCSQGSSYEQAGALGVNVLGMLTNQTLDELAQRIAEYRAARERHGFDPAAGKVTMLVHTFIGPDVSIARQIARGPMREYLRSYLDNRKKSDASKGLSDAIDAEETEYLLDRAFEDYVKGKAFFGTPESCLPVAQNFDRIGIDEFACFVDFGIDPKTVAAHFSHIAELQRLFNKAAGTGGADTGHGRTGTMAFSAARRMLPLTAGQTEIWLASCLGDDASAAFNQSSSVELRGPLDFAALNEAVQQVVARHDALRITIDPEGDGQVIHPDLRIDVPLITVPGDSAEEISRCASEIIATDTAAPFDLVQGPLLRVTVLKLADQHHQVVITAFHIICDGWSLGMAIKELSEQYSARIRSREPQLAAPMQFGDYLELVPLGRDFKG